jgi:hypothetical protein
MKFKLFYSNKMEEDNFDDLLIPLFEIPELPILDPGPPIPLRRVTRHFSVEDIFGLNFFRNDGLANLLREELEFINQDNTHRLRTNLEDISSDPENVHDSKVNKNIKKLATEILKFTPSEDLDVMKTIFNEIIMNDEVRAQLTYMYYNKNSFLDYGECSYRKFMDCIVSYALSQPEEKKKEIFDIMVREINDSIGLCFQGNISRLINVLSGFIEIEHEYEPSIQEAFAEISKIEDKNTKFEKAVKTFYDFNVPYVQWSGWLEALELE